MNTTATTTAVESVLDIIHTAVLSVVSAEGWDARVVESIHLDFYGDSDARDGDEENWQDIEREVRDSVRAAMSAAGYPAIDTEFIHQTRPRDHEDSECTVQRCTVRRAMMKGSVYRYFPGQRCSFTELMEAAQAELFNAEAKGLLNPTTASTTMVTALLTQAVDAVFAEVEGESSTAATQTADPFDDDF